MNNKIDNAKALKKWQPVLENMGIAKDASDRIEWMSEYAELHSIHENNAYANASTAGMGAVVSAQPSVFAGSTIGTNFANGGSVGSGDYGQQLLPVAMKIAAHTIGLDLVSVKPSAGPKIDLMYIDFQYDDLIQNGDEKPQLFKMDLNPADLLTVTTYLNNILTATGTITSQSALSQRIWIPLQGFSANVPSCTVEPTGTKQGVVEFMGYSRIDGFPIFRAYRQANTASSGGWTYDQTKNTFTATGTINAALVLGLDATTAPTQSATGALASATYDLVSAMEDQIPGFSTNFQTPGDGTQFPMNRSQDDATYYGAIGPKVSTKTIAVGTIEVSSSLRRTEIEDIKANTGMDIVQKMESVLVNELSQTISRQIVNKLFVMGETNRASAPLQTAAMTIVGGTIFDFDVPSYLSTNAPGGETSHAVQRRLISKILNASNYLATEGRIGPGQYIVTNGRLAAAMQDIAGYTINPVKSKLNGIGQLYPVGTIGDMLIYVDPFMKYNDNRILVGRKNASDQPGIVFVPYLMAQSISIISEATAAPRIFLRSRYAIAELGWYPQKQYMTIHVLDTNSNLI